MSIAQINLEWTAPTTLTWSIYESTIKPPNNKSKTFFSLITSAIILTEQETIINHAGCIESGVVVVNVNIVAGSSCRPSGVEDPSTACPATLQFNDVLIKYATS